MELNKDIQLIIDYLDNKDFKVDELLLKHLKKVSDKLKEKEK